MEVTKKCNPQILWYKLQTHAKKVSLGDGDITSSEVGRFDGDEGIFFHIGDLQKKQDRDGSFYFFLPNIPNMHGSTITISFPVSIIPSEYVVQYVGDLLNGIALRNKLRLIIRRYYDRYMLKLYAPSTGLLFHKAEKRFTSPP